ncbi:hypothetical protein FLP10_15115 [Agromyces intestinalis]|uniref:Ribbon-helix-helix protein, CopG family n=1 Tax=Agromyces intestinalis TaxID=2592652 RepID=A0A5C1YKF0_9MICO|nr:hypothetical protein [Agromyces intestinalis]QEO15609.1 hypothetical protein FLP10_15115 [Agromyces intestinalis]
MSTNSLAGTTRLDQPIPADLDRALNALVKASGFSKRSIVAEALRAHLVAHGVLPDSTPPIPPSLARGILAADRH